MEPGYHWWGGMGLFPVIMPIIMLVIILVFIYPMFRRSGPSCGPWDDSQHHYPPSSPNTDSALDILKKRYAKGEITTDEFEKMRRDIL